MEGAKEMMSEMESITNQYYSSNKKNMFFKNQQKMECAKTVTERVSLQYLLEKTAFQIPDTNIIYIDYTIFKYYANPDNYETAVAYILQLFAKCVREFNTLQIHLNLQSFTISAAERYKKVIEILCDRCFRDGTEYSRLLVKLSIYNTPTMIEHITRLFKPFIGPDVYSKIVMHKKDDSEQILEELFANKTG